MSGSYLAPSLTVFRAEINARWPNRDKTSDGWIGDAAHQASTSDHNPNSRGSVDAIDVDEDGVDFAVVFAAIKRHPSARYVIYERRLYHRLRGWRPEPYDGVNPHDHHFHVSIDQTREAEQDTRPWGLLEDDMPLTDADVRKIWTWDLLNGDGEDQAYRVLNRTAAMVAQLAGKDMTDEPAIVAGVLAGLTPQAIAAAIPTELARQVADELAARLAE